LTPDRLAQQAIELFPVLAWVYRTTRLAEAVVPVASDLRSTVAPQRNTRDRRRRQQPHLLEQRPVGEDVLEREVFEQRRLVHHPRRRGVREDGLLLGAEDEVLAPARVVERLDAIAIAH